MQTIARDQLQVVFDRRIPPVASVKSGELIRVETEDARGIDFVQCMGIERIGFQGQRRREFKLE